MFYFREDLETATLARIEIVHEIAERTIFIARVEGIGQEKDVDHGIGML